MDAADHERVSTTRPAEGTPPDTQVEACLRLAGGVGGVPPVPPVPPAVDEQDQGDGDDPDRNRFRDLCRRIADGFFHEVYVYAPDRLDRGRSDWSSSLI